MFRRPHYIAFGAVILLAVVLLNLSSTANTRLKLSMGGLFLPLFGLAGSTQSLTEQAGYAFLPRRELLQEAERLRQENDQLRFQLQQGQETARENQQLREALGWQRRAPWKLKLARVVGRDPANWWRTVQIDLGSRDGVTVDMPVITPEGIVGKISVVGFSRSQVLLVGDPNCRVSGLVQESRDSGVITPGSGNILDHQLVDLTFLPSSSTLLPGHTVVTSGLGGIYPKGITIGRVVDRRTIGFGLYAEARVKLAVNLNRIEEVWVMFP